jgi:hypothetical protein
LAVHLLRRYAACRSTAHEMSGGLSPAKLQRTITYIQAHLEQELTLVANSLHPTFTNGGDVSAQESIQFL